ncbi:MAG: hypothetical protein H0W75_01015 [Chitinophagaceae bacterium]|nr:hypothetical protein [Chitinophagaceae bacterium]
MADKKTYYKLDDIGFVGTQEKRSNTHIADAKTNCSYRSCKKICKGFFNSTSCNK